MKGFNFRSILHNTLKFFSDLYLWRGVSFVHFIPGCLHFSVVLPIIFCFAIILQHLNGVSFNIVLFCKFNGAYRCRMQRHMNIHQ